MVRSFVALLAFSLLFWVISFGLVVAPAYAFQISSSSTGYVRVASQAATSAMLSAQRSATLASVAPLISGSSAGSVAVRLVASSVGWPALGIVAGMTLAMVYYDSTKVAAIKTAAAPPAPYSIPGYTMPSGATITKCLSVGGPCPYSSTDYYMLLPPVSPATTCGVGMYTPPAGWAGVYSYGTQCQMVHSVGSANTPVAGTAAPATQEQVSTYVGGLPANDPNSIESNTVPVGAQVTPQPSDSTASNPVPDTALSTTVIPASTVAPTDLVVNPNATPPSGATQTTTGTQPSTGTSTKTTTTTTNPDGSVTTTSTDTQTDTASVSCTAGNHDQRTFGSILSTHVEQWKTVGILGTLNNLKNIVWPSALPTYTFGPTALGTFTLNLNTYSWAIADVRSITIAIAGLYGVAIVFRGRASA